MSLDASRRRFVRRTLFGAGFLGLRALASGIPAAVLLDPRRAAASADAGTEAFTSPQFLIYNTSQAGDPLNTNAPGTYLDPRIAHPADPRLAKASIQIGGVSYDAAMPWTTLAKLPKAPTLLDRLSLIHHSTGTEQHLQQPDVQELMGTVANSDMAVSAFSRLLAPVLGTIQPEPVTIGTSDSSEAISYGGRPQPMLNPQALAQVLGSPKGELAKLQQMRDQDLNRLNALYKASGTAAQRAFLDRYATSQTQTRQLSSSLLTQLAGIPDNTPDSQVRAALVLIQMKVAPVVTIHIPFGGDNHFDGDLKQEADQTVTGMATIVGLINALADAGLSDAVTFASMNVFGRTLTMQGAGRSHNANHHLTLLTGKLVRGGVIGGVTPLNGDYGALPISSTTGKGDPNGDITMTESLASVGKTLGAALGIPQSALASVIVYKSSGAPAGKTIAAALAS